MKPRNTAFALLATLIALMLGAREWIAYHWHGMTQKQRRGWFLFALATITAILSWLLAPFVKLLMFIN